MSYRIPSSLLRAFSSLCNKQTFPSCCKRQLSSTSAAEMKTLHIPVMLDEVLDCLDLGPKSTIIDMTFGAGGHTNEILRRFNDCHVIAVDRDKIAHEIAEDLSKQYKGRVTPILGKFSELSKLLSKRNYKAGSIDAVLIDAGCSSMQFDNSERGFSLSRDGPLDMRMDGNRNPDQMTAADVVNYLDQDDLAKILYRFGDERKADDIAESIIENRPITTTKRLATVVGNAVSAFNHSSRIDSIGRRAHAATKTFLALRIFVNDEMNELFEALKCAENYLRTDGRLVVITFHSLENRLVSSFLRKASQGKRISGAVKGQKELERSFRIVKDFLALTSDEEISRNPRSRSAVLRVATRCRI